MIITRPDGTKVEVDVFPGITGAKADSVYVDEYEALEKLLPKTHKALQDFAFTMLAKNVAEHPRFKALCERERQRLANKKRYDRMMRRRK